MGEDLAKMLGYSELLIPPIGCIQTQNAPHNSQTGDNSSLRSVQPGGQPSTTSDSKSLCQRVHTQHVESCDFQQLPGYLDEHMWRERHGKSGREAFASIIHNISKQYILI